MNYLKLNFTAQSADVMYIKCHPNHAVRKVNYLEQDILLGH
jgi:hypothetical protein